MTIGSVVIEDRQKYTAHQFPSSNRSLMEGVGQEEPGDQTWKQIDGETFIGEVFEQSQRYEWICPANFYSSIYNESFETEAYETALSSNGGPPYRIRDLVFPLTHNYFVNIRLNSDLTFYAGYGGIVVHSVDLNSFTLTIYLPSSFYQKHLKFESISDIQITNNYGSGTIIIRCFENFEYSDQKFKHRRNILHGGNENDVKINFYRGGNPEYDDFPTPNISPVFSNSNPNYRENNFQTTKSGEESTRKNKKKKKSGENWTHSDICVICGLICFIFSLVFLAMPFFVPKKNDFHLLDYYDYYQESDELQ